jgi:hypothetical protein
MNVIILSTLAIVLFGLAFLSKRRFGIHGLALAAGATLSSFWADTTGVVVSGLGVLPTGLNPTALAAVLITLLPALFLLIRGRKTKKIGTRLFGAVLFTVLAFSFIVEPVILLLPLDGSANSVYVTLLDYQALIVGAGLVIALIDVLLAKAPKPVPEEKHRH